MTDVELEGVSIRTMLDEFPDLSHLGEYRPEPGPEDRTIDRAARGDQGRGEHRYFVAPGWVEKRDHVEQNYRRMESYGRSWTSIGVRAVATVTITLDTGYTVRQTVESTGIWGVESDSPNNVIEQYARDEFQELREILTKMGIDAPETVEADYTGDARLKGTVTV